MRVVVASSLRRLVGRTAGSRVDGLRLGWLVGRLVGWPIGRSVGWLVGCLVGWSVGFVGADMERQLVGLLVCGFQNRSEDMRPTVIDYWLVGWLFDWLFDWLIDWLFDWLVGWLIDC